MRAGQIRKRLDEHGTPVQGLSTTDSAFGAELVGFVDDFQVDLEERFDVVAGEGYRDEKEILLALLHEVGDGVGGLRAEPCRRSDLGLPDETVWVAVAEALLDGPDGGGDFSGVWVATVHD